MATKAKTKARRRPPRSRSGDAVRLQQALTICRFVNEIVHIAMEMAARALNVDIRKLRAAVVRNVLIEATEDAKPRKRRR